MKVAWIFGAIGLAGSIVFGFCCPLVSVVNIFSILGIVYAVKAKNAGHPSTTGALVLSIIGVCLGPIVFIGFFALTAMTSR